MEVSVIIVSYNTCAHLDACLASIQAATSCSYEVIVVDNASTDGSAAMVRTRYPQVQVVQNACNAGYAIGNNQGAALARGRYLLLLNPDTRVETGAIERLVMFMDGHAEIGISAPQNRNGEDHELFGMEGGVQVNYFHFPRFQGLAGLRRAIGRRLGMPVAALPDPPPFVEHNGYILADWLRGCSLFVRTELYRSLEGMDEGFFLYLEDMDLCRRVRAKGLGCAVVKAAEIVHYGGVSYKDVPGLRIKTMLARHYLRAKYHYVRMERGRRGEWSVRLADLLYGEVGWVRVTLTKVTHAFRCLFHVYV